MNNNENMLLIKSSDIDVARFSCTELKNHTKYPDAKPTAYINYDHPTKGKDTRLKIQLPPIHISTGGVPKANEKYFKDDRSRSHIKIPIVESIEESKNLMEKLKEIDNHMDSEKIRRMLFGDKWQKIKYSRIMKLNDDDDDDDEKKNKIPMLKVKIDLSFPDGKIKSQVLQPVMENGEYVMEDVMVKKDGKDVPFIKDGEVVQRVKRNKLGPFDSLDEFAKAVPWKSTVTLVLIPKNIWCTPINGVKTYGIKLVLEKLDVEYNSESGNGNNAMNSDDFLDDDKKAKSVKPSKVAQVESSDDEDDDDDAPPTVIPTKKSTVSTKKQTTQIESDDEDDDKPVVKKQIESDSEDDDKPVVKKPAPKATRGGKGGKSAHA